MTNCVCKQKKCTETTVELQNQSLILKRVIFFFFFFFFFFFCDSPRTYSLCHFATETLYGSFVRVLVMAQKKNTYFYAFGMACRLTYTLPKMIDESRKNSIIYGIWTYSFFCYGIPCSRRKKHSLLRWPLLQHLLQHQK